MAQVAKSTKDFEIFGGLNPSTVKVSTENYKDKAIFDRCAVLRHAGSIASRFECVVRAIRFCRRTAIGPPIHKRQPH